MFDLKQSEVPVLFMVADLSDPSSVFFNILQVSTDAVITKEIRRRQKRVILL